MNLKYSHSNATFEHTHNNTLIKYQKDICKSANKQLSFFNTSFLTPPVIEIRQHSFEMEYIECMPLPEYFKLISKNECFEIIDKLINFAFGNVSQYTYYGCVVFNNKVNEIISRLSKREHLDAAMIVSKFLSKHTSVRVAGGDYHGDLTFSNVLVSSSGKYLIDFLPGYIQSPELDFVKLIQEAKLFWSYLLAPLSVNENYFLACDYLNTQLSKRYRPKTPIIEAINYLRILPYVKNDAIGTILCNEINNILQ